MKVISYLFFILLFLIVFIGWFPQSLSNWFTILSSLTSVCLGLWSVILSYFGPDAVLKFQIIKYIKNIKNSFTSERLVFKSVLFLMKDLNVEDYWTLQTCMLSFIDSAHSRHMMFPNDDRYRFDPSRICIIVSPSDTRVASLDHLASKGYLNKVKIPGLIEYWEKCIGKNSFFYIAGWKLAAILDIDCDCQSTKARDVIYQLSEMTIDYKPTSIGGAMSVAFPM